MKALKWARLLPALFLVVVPFIEGCGDFWQAPSGSTGTGTGTGTGTTLSSGIFYVLNETNEQVVAYQINSGSLSTIGTSSLTVAPSSIAVAPGNAFLYVGTPIGGAGIFLYSIGSNGALTAVDNGQVISSDTPTAMQVDPTGTWLIDSYGANSTVVVNAIPITSTGTVVNPQQPEWQRSYTVTGAAANKLAISGDDNYIFIAAGGGTLVIPFTPGNTSANPLGNAKLIGLVNTSDGAAQSVAVDPSSSPRLFYVGETSASSSSGGLRAFDYSALSALFSTGTISDIAGSPYASGGLAPAAILPDPTGSYVYVASGQGTSNGVIQGFNIASSTANSTTTYTLSSISTVATGVTPVGLAEDSNGNFVLSASSSSSDGLGVYIFDTTTPGQLDVTNIQPSTGAGAIAVAAQAP
jgi:6-phosphogluconolactonase (cycloisomerase 2 family)